MSAQTSGDCVKESFKWITNNLIKRAVENATLKNNVNIESFSLKPALPEGENFASQLLRSKIVYDGDCELNVILKVGMISPEMQEKKDEIDSFGKERLMFKEILPKIEKLFENVGEKVTFSARLFECTQSPQCLFMEDLSIDGYKNGSKYMGLDMAHMKAALSKLAQYHAATATLGTTDRTSIERYLPKLINDEHKAHDPFFGIIISSTLEAVRVWPGFELIAKKLSVLGPKLKQICIDTVYERDEDGFNVLLHGDLWTNNIMYQYDDYNSIADVKLIDFQISSWASPAIDLTYLLFTSSEKGFTGDQLDELLLFYHTKLSETLEKLGYTKQIPTLIQLHGEFLKRSAYAIPIALILHSFRTRIQLQKDTSAFFNDNIESVEFRRKLFLSKEFRENVQPLLKYFDRKGLLDQ